MKRPVTREREIARDAVTRCSSVLRINSNDADAWHVLGAALARLGDRAGAFTALRNALLLDETRPQTYLELGNLLFDTGRLDDALRCFERAAERDPAFSPVEP
ncbi:MAG TPA: tetratricopeptide repeat protein [Steroidobacteraceae bacterium]|nr:tetratricopeptide repeat protein [Steroidobacteraceae bacterium]